MLRAKRRGYRRRVGVAGALLIILSLSHAALAGPVSGYVGHTSPHSRDLPSENFSRPDKDGKIRPVSLIPQEKPYVQTLLSGTVYYMVFERDDRDPNDPWGTGIPNFVKTFRAGIDFNGGASPDINAASKYLYLYQVINHQRTLPPIESMSIKLLVELSEITSWGYFDGLGFATKEDDQVVRPLSATHKIDSRTFLSPAPALAEAKPLTLAYVPTLRGEAQPQAGAGKGKIVQVHWDALDPATPPDYVMILGSSDFDKHPSFRAIWSGKNAIGKDGRSIAFGFTSPMPPTIEPVRLRTSREAIKEVAAEIDEKPKDEKTVLAKNPVSKTKEAIKLARMAEGEATSAGETVPGVEGRAPTPFPTSASLAFDPNRDDKTSKSGAGLPPAAIPTSSPSSPGGFGGGSSGSGSTSPSPGGGGGVAGFSSGGGSSRTVQNVTTTTTTTSQSAGASSASASNVNNINFNISQSNQQSQSQFQYQSQHQRQSQHQNQSDGAGKGSVVPEPASLIGLAIGLPALLIAYRRRRRPDSRLEEKPS